MPISQEKVKIITKNIYICKVCGIKFYSFPSVIKNGGGTCSKKCGYKIRIIKPNAGQFKKGNIPWQTGIGWDEETKKKMSKIRMESPFRTGEGHPRWEYGCRSYYRNIAHIEMKKKGDKKICRNCQTIDNIELHHRDKDYTNNIFDNLVYLCKSCHMRLHHIENRVKDLRFKLNKSEIILNEILKNIIKN